VPRWPLAAAALPLAYLGREVSGPALGTVVLVVIAALALRPHPRLDARRRARLAAAALAGFVAVHLIDLATGIVLALAVPSAVLAALAWRELDAPTPARP
jgi:hypothetical protein